MTLYMKNPTAGGAAGLDKTSLPGRNDYRDTAPQLAPLQAELVRNPRAVLEAKRLLKLEFLHECAGGIAVHAGLVQTFAEIGDRAGACYAMRRMFAHAKAAHPIYLELRDEAARAGTGGAT
jgi:hypothetical protein